MNIRFNRSAVWVQFRSMLNHNQFLFSRHFFQHLFGTCAHTHICNVRIFNYQKIATSPECFINKRTHAHKTRHFFQHKLGACVCTHIHIRMLEITRYTHTFKCLKLGGETIVRSGSKTSQAHTCTQKQTHKHTCTHMHTCTHAQRHAHKSV